MLKSSVNLNVIMRISNYFKNDTIIQGDRIVLRKIKTSDTDDMFEYSSNPETSKYLLWSPHMSREVTKSTIGIILDGYKNGTFHDFAAVLKENGKMIGTVGFTSVDEANCCAEIGYVLNPKYHGHGYATEAVKLLLNFAFCELGLNRIEARYMPENEASLKVMERVGMTCEGILRSRLYVKGQFKNVGVCSILSNDYYRLPRKNIYSEQRKTSLFGRLFRR